MRCEIPTWPDDATIGDTLRHPVFGAAKDGAPGAESAFAAGLAAGSAARG